MNMLSFLLGYLGWHYSTGFAEIKNFNWLLLRRVWDGFSLKSILRTFFSPWKRMAEEYKRGRPEEWFGTLIVNSLMRLVGMAVRSLIIIIGFLIFFLGIIFSVCLLIAWALWPIMILILFFMGVKLLIL